MELNVREINQIKKTIIVGYTEPTYYQLNKVNDKLIVLTARFQNVYLFSEIIIGYYDAGTIFKNMELGKKYKPAELGLIRED